MVDDDHDKGFGGREAIHGSRELLNKRNWDVAFDTFVNNACNKLINKHEK